MTSESGVLFQKRSADFGRSNVMLSIYVFTPTFIILGIKSNIGQPSNFVLYNHFLPIELICFLCDIQIHEKK